MPDLNLAMLALARLDPLCVAVGERSSRVEVESVLGRLLPEECVVALAELGQQVAQGSVESWARCISREHHADKFL